MGFFDFLGKGTAQTHRRTPGWGFRFSKSPGTSPSAPIVVLPPNDLAKARASFRQYYVKHSPNPEAAATAIGACPGNPNLEAFCDEMMLANDKGRYLEERFGPQGLKWGGAGNERMDATGVHKQTIAFPDGRRLTLHFDCQH